MDDILIGKGERPVHLLPRYGNRHGLVAGATGTGKTISLMVMAEGFSRLGVPVFMADVKGDVAGLAMAGAPNDKIRAARRPDRHARLQQRSEPRGVLGSLRQGRPSHPRDDQRGRPEPAGSHARDQRHAGGHARDRLQARGRPRALLLDLDDLRALLGFVADNRKEISTKYGLISTQSVAAIQRALLGLEREGGEALFGEPALDLEGHDAHGYERPRPRQHPGGRPAHPEAAALLELPLVAACPSSSRASRRSAISTSRSWCSSSTRRICSSTTRRRRCASGSSRSSGSSDRRASASTSARSSPTTCRTRSWASSAIESSTRCAPTRRATRRRCAPRPRRSWPTPSSTSPR